MAIATVQAEMTLSVNGKFTKTNTSLNSTSVSQSYTTSNSFATAGAGSGAINQEYMAIRTLAGAATEDLDFAGSLTNFFGETITFARIKSISIELLTTTTSTSIEVGGAAATQWVGPFGAANDTVEVLNGGFVAFSSSGATGWTVTAGSTDLLKILNNDASNTATYRITVFGSTS